MKKLGCLCPSVMREEALSRTNLYSERLGKGLQETQWCWPVGCMIERTMEAIAMTFLWVPSIEQQDLCDLGTAIYCDFCWVWSSTWRRPSISTRLEQCVCSLIFTLRKMSNRLLISHEKSDYSSIIDHSNVDFVFLMDHFEGFFFSFVFFFFFEGFILLNCPFIPI